MTARSKNPVHWRGFTLVELLVVISIISLVLGMTLPAIMQLLTAGVSERGEAVFSALLGTARGLAVQRQTYVLVHFQMGPEWVEGPPGTWSSRPDGKSYGAVMVCEPVTDDTGKVVRYQFVPLAGYAPRALLAGFALGEASGAFIGGDNDFIPIKDEDLINFTTFNIIFAPDGSICQLVPNLDPNTGEVVPAPPDIDITCGLFSNDHGEAGMWRSDGVDVSEEGVRVVVAFEYRALRSLNDGTYAQEGSRAYYLQNEGKILCINPYTGKLLPSE